MSVEDWRKRELAFLRKENDALRDHRRKLERLLALFPIALVAALEQALDELDADQRAKDERFLEALR